MARKAKPSPIYVRLSDRQLAAVKRLARSTQETMSGVVRRLVQAGIDALAGPQ